MVVEFLGLEYKNKKIVDFCLAIRISKENFDDRQNVEMPKIEPMFFYKVYQSKAIDIKNNDDNSILLK